MSMRSPSLSKAQIFEAAEQLTLQGQRPSVTNIRKMIGSGSYTTIDVGLQEWKNQQAISQSMMLTDPLPVEVAEHSQQWVNELWALALSKANAHVQAEREALEKARQELEATHQEAIELADQVNNELEQWQQRCHDLQAQHEQLKQDHECALNQARQADSFKQQYELQTQHLHELKTQFDVERQQVTTVHQQAIQTLKTAYKELEQQLKTRQAELIKEFTEKKQQIAKERDSKAQDLVNVEKNLAEKSKTCEQLQGQLLLLKEQIQNREGLD